MFLPVTVLSPAGSVKPKLLILYHLVIRDPKEDKALKAVREQFAGEVTLANGLDVFCL